LGISKASSRVTMFWEYGISFTKDFLVLGPVVLRKPLKTS